jgi:cellulose synthase/poly-beta-1,6-N-acetylglucosamine synthase-like glycosyltransferase/peptidoglycan/xylan/chitin deacetylase (PgdA/CDA1 family)
MSSPRVPSRRRRLSTRHMLLSLFVIVLLAMLALRGYVHSEILADHRVRPPAPTDEVPERVLEGGPVLDIRDDGRPVSYEVPDRTVVLTFDDGPDPTWTPKILDKLKEYHAHAVFFVTGTMTTRYPELVKRIVAEGHEVGVHTFNHPDLSYQSHSRIDWELRQSQLALAGAAGIHTSLFRPPYSATADALDNKSWPVTRYIGEHGYVTVFNNTDGEDWARPGVDEIVRRVLPKKRGDGAIALLHDSGGNRSQTVAALDVLLPRLQADGYTFPTLSEALGAPTAHTEVTGLELWKGKAFVTAVGLSERVTGILAVVLVGVGVLILARFALMLPLARTHARRVRERRFPLVTDPVTVLVPAYNEAKCIAKTVRSLDASDHPIEIIVIDDGSTDGTADIVEQLDLPRVRVLRQANAGKPAALNNGIAHARHDIIVMMDGDTVFEPSTVRELVQHLGDPAVGAVAGNTKVGNRHYLLAALQHIEYVVGINLDRRMYEILRCIPTIPGACGAFRRDALARVGGMSDETLAEDTDITMTLHRDGWHVAHAQRAIAWTEVPTTFRQLWSQRYRWSYGTMQAIWKHRRALAETGPSGRFGRVGLPLVSLFGVIAPLLGPLIDIFLAYGLVFGATGKTVGAWLGVLAIQTFCAVYAFRLEGERLVYLLLLPLQQLFYRQLMYGVVVRSWISALNGNRLRWQKLRRTGAVEVPMAASPARDDRVPQTLKKESLA